MKKIIDDQSAKIEIQRIEIKSLKQQLGKQGAIIEYQDENLKEIEQQCVLEKSFMEKIEKFLQNAVFSATMLGNLINDMLDLAKFESGTFKFHNDYFRKLRSGASLVSVMFSHPLKQLRKGMIYFED